MNQTNSLIAADNDEYWTYLSAHFPSSPAFINLENGYCGVLAHPVLNALQRYQSEINSESSYFLRTRWKEQLLLVKLALAKFCGVDSNELLITRNLTESFASYPHAYPFKIGDEIIYADIDYDSVQQIVTNIAKAKKLALIRLSIANQALSDEDLVSLYEQAITANTRIIILTHLLHRNGQILPVAKIAQMARRHQVDVFVDAAHSFAHLDYQLPDLASDFVGVNLHKWLGAPLGTGLLFIRRERLAEMSATGASDIEELGFAGTFAPAPVLAIADAICFHQSIGTSNIEHRLRHLSQYWLQQLNQLPEIRQHTPDDPQRSCAIRAISIDGISANEVVDYLMSEHQIFTVLRTIGEQDVVRITPHVFTSKAALDRLVMAIKKLVAIQRFNA
ncbi:MAG: aminotransferase class V-fold PLP-dependent enzyme [Undibacterium sp.]|nr:aminotransferase class V-fold PLP-dependent enzyme [Undibacterium sp.]